MIWLNIPGLARPVRMCPKSAWVAATEFSMDSSASKRMVSIIFFLFAR